MSKPVLLWFDCSPSVQLPDLQEQLSQFFCVARSCYVRRAKLEIQRVQPRVLCFDFDFPEPSHLKTMQAIKQEHIRLPILMLTLGHSEALAVWAFRARVWNYLVKPIGAVELQENLRALAQIATAEQRYASAVTLPRAEVPHEVPASRPANPRTQLLPALSFLETHFSEHISESELAALCGISPCHFSRLFRATFGVTFQDYVLSHRVREACRLLERPNVAVANVGYAVGFNDASYFSRIFRRYMGVPPSEYHGSHMRPAAAAPAIAVRRRARDSHEVRCSRRVSGDGAGSAAIAS